MPDIGKPTLRVHSGLKGRRFDDESGRIGSAGVLRSVIVEELIGLYDVSGPKCIAADAARSNSLCELASVLRVSVAQQSALQAAHENPK